MKRFVIAAVLIALAGPSAAQTKPSPNAPGAADTKVRLRTLGYKNVHDLRRGPDGQWVGKATRGNIEKFVTVSPRGNVVAR
jgi:hypothetical protein